MKICLENFLGFGCVHENKIFFLFLKKEINLKVWKLFGFFFEFFLEIF
jgi:hypothetical protein